MNDQVIAEKSITAVSAFAGVGGFDLALERNGIETVVRVPVQEEVIA